MASITSQHLKTISDVLNKIGNVSLSSVYQCEFALPTLGKVSSILEVSVGFIGSNVNDINREIVRLSCAEASLPGSSLATTEINNDYTGVTEKHAYRRLYDSQASFTFYVDKEYRIIDFFENWIAYISGETYLNGQQEKIIIIDLIFQIIISQSVIYNKV